jgi:hypothetical protein
VYFSTLSTGFSTLKTLDLWAFGEFSTQKKEFSTKNLWKTPFLVLV